MKSLTVGLLATGALAALLGLAAAAPSGMRRMDSFKVRRVELRGTRYLAPHQALKASGINEASNVFDDFDVWVDSLVKHPLVAVARIERVLPSTLRIFVEEAVPVALTSDAGADAGVGELVPVNESGEVLPIDPAQVDLDLPVVSVPATAYTPAPAPASTSAPTSASASAPLQRVLRVLIAIRDAEPAMYGWISDAELESTTGVRIHLRAPAGAQAVVPFDPPTASLRQLRLTLADLAAREDITRLVRIDARYRDQIVVTLTKL